MSEENFTKSQGWSKQSGSNRKSKLNDGYVEKFIDVVRRWKYRGIRGRIYKVRIILKKSIIEFFQYDFVFLSIPWLLAHRILAIWILDVFNDRIDKLITLMNKHQIYYKIKQIINLSHSLLHLEVGQQMAANWR